MAAVTDFLPFHQREDVSLSLAFLTPPPGGVAGWAVRFVLKNPYTGAAVLTLDNGGAGGVVVTDAAAGAWAVTVPSAGLDLAAQEYDWQFARTDTGAKVVLGEGKWPVARSWAV